MNCANHADVSAAAYCRTCGKALCANCTRPVRGVIYCEDCLGARMEAPSGTTAGFAPGAPPVPPVPPAVVLPPLPGQTSGPNPALAGILAGFFPFGVGAVYTGQYTKGLAHLMIFGLLVAGCTVSGDVIPTICGIGIAFFYVYQIIDSVRSARAIQTGQPVPDPFGLTQMFGPVDRLEAKKIPTGAVILILIGVLFLLHTMGLSDFGMDRFWPLILIVLGGWLLMRNLGMMGSTDAPYRSRRLMGPAMLLTIGVLFLLQSLRVAHFDRTWPVILLVVGAVKLLQSTSASGGPSVPPPPSVPSSPSSGTEQAAPNSTEVNRG
jgi:hypothetical protein